MRRVIVIGASSGIGEDLAKHYAQCGYKVGIAARRVEELKRVANFYPDNIIYQAIDVTILNRESSVAEDQCDIYGAQDGVNKLLERLGGADLVIYSSGYGKNHPDLNLDVDINTVKVNVEGFVNVAITALEYFSNIRPKEDLVSNIKSKHNEKVRAQFVVISSIASTKGLGSAAAYSATKRFQSIYMEGLAQLMNKLNREIDFTSIMPGFVDTDFISKERYPMVLKRDYAVKLIIRAIERRKREKIIDWKWRIIVTMWRLIPSSIWRKMKI